MKQSFNLLAVTPTVAQIVLENKGYVLSGQDKNDGNEQKILITAGAVVLLAVLILAIVLMRRHHRRYRAR